MKKELMALLGYHLYSFRMDYQLTEEEMANLLFSLIETKQFKKEYGIDEE